MANHTGYPDTQAFFYTCRQCDTVERIDYAAETTQDGMLFTGWYRLEGGAKVYWNSDVKCPVCQRNRRHGNLKATYKASRQCDDACKEARGEKCVCSCGGRHHGEKHSRHTQIVLFA